MPNFYTCYELAKKLIIKEERSFFTKRVKLAFRLYFFYPTLIDGIDTFFSGSPLRSRILATPGFAPEIYKQQTHSSFYRHSTKADRLHFLKEHFLLLEKTHQENIVDQFYAATIEPIVFQQGDTKLSFQIRYHPDVAREGFLWLQMEMNDEIVYKITFWLMEQNGIRTLCIGTLQGGKATLESNRLFTKEFWGLRPQNMAITALRWYAQTLGISQIFSLPADKFWSKKIKDRTAIAEFLQEQGATVVENSPFVKIEMHSTQKDLSEIPTRKRSMYKKRYEFLDNLRTKLTVHFQEYVKDAESQRESRNTFPNS